MNHHIQETQQTMEALHDHLRAALLSQNTRDAIGHSGAVQEASAVVLRQLDQALSHARDRDAGPSGIHRTVVQAAQRAMSQAIENGERVAIGSNIDEMRDRLIDVKTQIDYADAYLRIATGRGDL